MRPRVSGSNPSMKKTPVMSLAFMRDSRVGAALSWLVRVFLDAAEASDPL